jgi:hypothetical protein
MTLNVKDFRKPGMDDDECIAACMAYCSAQKIKEPMVVFDGGDWHIGRAILVPSGMTVIVDGCTIKQKDYTFDNVFRGANVEIDPQNPFVFPLSVGNLENIRILGKNGAKIAGPDINRRGFHSVIKEEQDMTGDYWGWRTLQISLSKCTGFEIGGFSFAQTRCWAMAMDLCSYGDIHDLHIESYIKNGDGVDFEPGCHHYKVRNISGRTSDDSVSLHGLLGGNEYPIKNYLYPMKPALPYPLTYVSDELNIHDIEISDVETSGDCHGVIAICYGGLQVYNISIRNIRETGSGERLATVEFYSGRGYGEGYRPGDMHDITVDGVTAEFATYAFKSSNVEVKNVTLRNIKHNRPGAEAVALDYPEGIRVCP